MTQAELFRNAAGGFAYGSELPNETGTLSTYKVLTIDAIANDDTASIVRRLVTCLEQKPVRGLEQLGRQYKELINALFNDYKHVVIVITSAHFLPVNTIRKLKAIKETQSGYGSEAGFVLLGDITALKEKIEKCPEISQRSFEFLKENL